MTNCGGGDGGGNESCCTSLEVTGGNFYRTYTNDGDGGGGEADPASVTGFRLDKYEVTVGRFRQFVNAVLPPDGGAGWLPLAGSGKHTHLNGGLGLVNVGADAGTTDAAIAYETGWGASDNSNIAPTNSNLGSCPVYGTWTNTVGSQETLPINCVNWWEAYAFCIWDGGFLPSEAEWEYAAAGGSQQREYPWGSTAPGTSSQYAIYACYYPSGSSFCGGMDIASVGYATQGAGLWGQLDLAGNVWEWNLDWYMYLGSYPNPCTDCAHLTNTPPIRVYRGGSFDNPLGFLMPPQRDYDTPTSRFDTVGFRCARTP
jgi:formylglycine-generating enzyme required for sulfatase activity